MSRLRVASRNICVARSVGLAFCLVMSTVTLAAATASSASASPKPSTPRNSIMGNSIMGNSIMGNSIMIGNHACGHVGVTPSTNLTGGEAMTVAVTWHGSPTSTACQVEDNNCPDFWGSCDAGFWVAGLFCSTLAATDLAAAQSDCDLNNIVVLTDYNAGPDNSGQRGTSYNQCSTLSTIGSIFGGLPGTLNCIPDGHAINGWSEKWKLGSTYGRGFGPVEATGSSAPFKPGTAGVDCPPSAANIAAGALPGYCVFVVLPIDFTYYCVFDVCLPNTGDANDGVTEVTSDYMAVLLQYANAPAATQKGAQFMKP